MTVSLKEEFRCRSLGLGYDRPHKFFIAQWHGFPDCLFICWRVFWALWHLAWISRSAQVQFVINSNSDPAAAARWFIFLTNWSYLILTIQSLLHLAVVIYTRCSGRGRPPYQPSDHNPWYNKLLWLFTAMSFPAAIVVTIFYWVLLFDGVIERALSIMTHAVTSFYVITDMFISASPWRLLHFIYPVIYGAAYAIMSLIYHFAGGTNNDGEPFIYEALDWRRGGPTVGIVLGVTFVAAPLAHLFLFGLFTIRLYLHQNCCGQVGPEEEEEMSTIKPTTYGGV